METACRTCSKPVVGRVYVNRPGDAVLFIETYECGSVRAWGRLRTDGDPQLRRCPDAVEQPA